MTRAALGFGADLAGFEVRLFDQRQIDLLDDAALELLGRRLRYVALLERGDVDSSGKPLLFNIVRPAVILEHEILAEAVARSSHMPGWMAF